MEHAQSYQRIRDQTRAELRISRYLCRGSTFKRRKEETSCATYFIYHTQNGRGLPYLKRASKCTEAKALTSGVEDSTEFESALCNLRAAAKAYNPEITTRQRFPSAL